MFQPVVVHGTAYFDVRRLITTRCEDELDTYIQAFLNASYKYGFKNWACTVKDGCIKIDATKYYTETADVRHRMSKSRKYLTNLQGQMLEDTLNLEKFKLASKKRHRKDLIEALSWFPNNWLFPFYSTKFLLSKYLNQVDASKLLNQSLLNPLGSLYLQEKFIPSPSHTKLLSTFDDLINKIISPYKKHFSKSDAELIETQLTFISTMVWQEERRRQIQDIIFQNKE